MRVLLNNGKLVKNDWLAAGANNATSDRRVLLTLAELDQQMESERFAVQLSPEDDPKALIPVLESIVAIAIDFTDFMDGRGFSQVRFLREVGYRGEILATGNYIRDQLFYLSKVGVDAFVLPAEANVEDWRRAFQEIGDSYQSNADQALPLFRRR